MIALRNGDSDKTLIGGRPLYGPCPEPPWMTDERLRKTIPLTLVALALVAFAGTLAVPFHYDDFSLFGDPAITSPSGWYQVWGFEHTRPLTKFTFWLNYMLGGENPIGYHAVNLAIHAIAVFLLFGVLRELMPPYVALIAAALFAIHPIQTEPVAYIWARGTLLMTVFCLLTMRAWLRGRVGLAIVLFALALLAKEECVAFPFFLLVFGFTALTNRWQNGAIVAMLGLSLFAGIRAMYVVGVVPGSGAGAGADISSLDYLLAQGTVLWRYFQLLVVPFGFTPDPGIALPPVWLSLLAWAAVATLVILSISLLKEKGPGIWLVVGLALLMPSSSIFPANDLAADRRMYLPLAAFAPVVALLLCRLRARWLIAIGVVILALTLGRVYVWQSQERLWAEAVHRAPEKVRPKIQLARVVNDERALALLLEAEEIAPDDPAVASEIGKRLLQMNRPAEALPKFGRALALDPNNPLGYNNRGVALMQLNQRKVAIQDFQRALTLDPCQFDAHFNLRQLGVRTTVPARCRFTGKQTELLSK